MVDKIDKPDAPPAYFIQRSAETKRDRQQPQPQPGPEDEFSGSHASPEWQRIHARATNRRYLKLRRDDVLRCYFRGVLMQRGMAILEVDIELKDGRMIRNAQMILTLREDYWRLKGFTPGGEVPPAMVLREPVLEVSIPGPVEAQMGTPVQPTAGQKKLDIRKVAIYAAIGVAVLLLVIFALVR